MEDVHVIIGKCKPDVWQIWTIVQVLNNCVNVNSGLKKLIILYRKYYKIYQKYMSKTIKFTGALRKRQTIEDRKVGEEILIFLKYCI